MHKREFIKLSTIGLGSLFAMPLFGKNSSGVLFPRKIKEFKLPDLPYSYNALEPFMDEATLRLHHLNHHAGYTNKFNELVSHHGISGISARDILSKVSQYSDDIRNNGGGYLNHKLFWRTLSPDGGGAPHGKLLDVINKSFGSFEKFKTEFSNTAFDSMGSGWVWLILDDSGSLKITATENQDNPVMDTAEVKGRPLLLLDLWEHAYYLQYKDSREKYVENFWNFVNWEFIEKKYEYLSVKSVRL
jgi:superoxide dismutase, Fe-Mn family